MVDLLEDSGFVPFMSFSQCFTDVHLHQRKIAFVLCFAVDTVKLHTEIGIRIAHIFEKNILYLCEFLYVSIMLLPT